jgi:hypothetical protein
MRQMNESKKAKIVNEVELEKQNRQHMRLLRKASQGTDEDGEEENNDSNRSSSNEVTKKEEPKINLTIKPGESMKAFKRRVRAEKAKVSNYIHCRNRAPY